MLPIPSLDFTGGAAGPAMSSAGDNTTVNLSLPFSESAFNVGGYQSAQQSPTLDGPAGAAPASSSISPLLLIGGALLVYLLVRHGARP